jgi:TonB family protein
MTEAWRQWQGQVVNGELELKKCLGGGERSAVFLTEFRGREARPAAIKLVAADPAHVERQLSRWALAQRLSHPHLIRILQTGRCRLDARDLIFVLMEYGEENLAQILPERRLTPEEAREMLEPTLGALAYLHGQGLAHGHLKPANVLAVNDQLKLASDSICHTNEDEAAFYPGKPGVYDPPEMARGKYSPAADVWSLGMTLAEALTQGLPFWIEQDQEEPILPDNLPAPFAEILRGCLRRDPQRRLTIAGIASRLRARTPQPAARAAKMETPAQPRATKTETPQPPSRPAIVKPMPAKPPSQNPPTISYLEVRLRRYAIPAVVVIAAVVAALLAMAGLGLFRHQPSSPPDVTTVKPAESQEAKEPGKPSPKTPAHKTKPETGRQSSVADDRPDATAETSPQSSAAGNRPVATSASQVQTPPVKLISDLPAPARNGSASRTSNSGPDGSSLGGPNNGPTGGSRDSGIGGDVVQQVLPNVPQSARDTIQGTVRVRVRVKVDPSGNVTGADLDSPGPSKYFARLSLEAAHRWKFVPGQGAGRDFLVHFEFRNSGTKAFATRAGG